MMNMKLLSVVTPPSIYKLCLFHSFINWPMPLHITPLHTVVLLHWITSQNYTIYHWFKNKFGQKHGKEVIW